MQVRIEPSAGGGGQSEARLAKIAKSAPATQNPERRKSVNFGAPIKRIQIDMLDRGVIDVFFIAFHEKHWFCHEIEQKFRVKLMRSPSISVHPSNGSKWTCWTQA